MKFVRLKSYGRLIANVLASFCIKRKLLKGYVVTHCNTNKSASKNGPRIFTSILSRRQRNK